MADTTATKATKPRTKPAAARKPRKAAASSANAEPVPAKARFARALDEARAGAQQLGKEAQNRAQRIGKEAQQHAGAYREKLTEASTDWVAEARVRGGQAKDLAADLAREGKSRASEAIATLGKVVGDNAALVDDKVGAKYGDYARKAASTMQDTAARLDAKELDELGEDAK